MEIKWLEDFVSLAETHSFSRSAALRHVTQPAFSRRIQALEAWLGSQLIDRSAYPTRLTQAGRVFHAQALAMIAQAREARTLLKGESGAPATLIDMAVPHTLSLTFFPRWLAHLEARLSAEAGSPQRVHVRLRALNVHDAVLSLVEGGCDLVMAYHHPSQPVTLDPERYEMLVLGSEQLSPFSAPVVTDVSSVLPTSLPASSASFAASVSSAALSSSASPSSPASRSASVTRAAANARTAGNAGNAGGAVSAVRPRHLLPGRGGAAVPFLSYTRDAYLGRMTELVLANATPALRLDKVYETDMAEGLKAMALAGHGVAFLPHSAVEEAMATGQLLRLDTPSRPGQLGRFSLSMEIRLYRDRVAAESNSARSRLLDRLWHAIAADRAQEKPSAPPPSVGRKRAAVAIKTRRRA